MPFYLQLEKLGLIVIISGDFSAKKLTHVPSAETKFRRPEI
jgi:hypothetical protein